MKRLATLVSLVILLSLNTVAMSQRIVTASQVNGTWQSGKNTFKVWALGKQKLKVEFFGTYEYKTPAGWMANIGEGSGIAHIEGDTAVFKPAEIESGCKITMKFRSGKLYVTQEGGCDFGHNVSAAGTYRRTSSRRPKFDESEWGKWSQKLSYP